MPPVDVRIACARQCSDAAPMQSEQIGARPARSYAQGVWGISARTDWRTCSDAGTRPAIFMKITESLLRTLAETHPDVLGATGDAMRARVAAHAAFDLIQDVMLADARAREAVATGARMALRCGTLLLKGGGDSDKLLRTAGISEQAAAGYVALALAYPELAEIGSRRFGRLTEAQALETMGRSHAADPVHDLRALCGLLA